MKDRPGSESEEKACEALAASGPWQPVIAASEHSTVTLRPRLLTFRPTRRPSSWTRKTRTPPSSGSPPAQQIGIADSDSRPAGLVALCREQSTQLVVSDSRLDRVVRVDCTEHSPAAHRHPTRSARPTPKRPPPPSPASPGTASQLPGLGREVNGPSHKMLCS